MFLGFILGFAAGVIFIVAYQIHQEQKEFEEELDRLEKETMEENREMFTYDCLNKTEPVEEELDKHIPKIN